MTALTKISRKFRGESEKALFIIMFKTAWMPYQIPLSKFEGCNICKKKFSVVQKESELPWACLPCS